MSMLRQGDGKQISVSPYSYFDMNCSQAATRKPTGRGPGFTKTSAITRRQKWTDSRRNNSLVQARGVQPNRTTNAHGAQTHLKTVAMTDMVTG